MNFNRLFSFGNMNNNVNPNDESELQSMNQRSQDVSRNNISDIMDEIDNRPMITRSMTRARQEQTRVMEVIYFNENIKLYLNEQLNHRLRPINPYSLDDISRFFQSNNTVLPDIDPIRRTIHTFIHSFVNLGKTMNCIKTVEENSVIDRVGNLQNDNTGKLKSLTIDWVKASEIDKMISNKNNYKSVFPGNVYDSIFPENNSPSFEWLFKILSNVNHLFNDPSSARTETPQHRLSNLLMDNTDNIKEEDYIQMQNILSEINNNQQPQILNEWNQLNELRRIYYGNLNYNYTLGILPEIDDDDDDLDDEDFEDFEEYGNNYMKMQPALTAAYAKAHKKFEYREYKFSNRDNNSITYNGIDRTEIYDKILFDLCKYWIKTFDVFHEWDKICLTEVIPDITGISATRKNDHTLFISEDGVRYEVDFESSSIFPELEVFNKFMHNRRGRLDLLTIVIVFLFKNDKINSFLVDCGTLKKNIKERIDYLDDLPFGTSNLYKYYI